MSTNHLIDTARRVITHWRDLGEFGLTGPMASLAQALEAVDSLELETKDQQIKAMGGEIDNLKTGLQAANSTITGNREQIRRLLSQLAEAQDRIKELEEERDRLKAQLGDAENLLDIQVNEIKQAVRERNKALGIISTEDTQ